MLNKRKVVLALFMALMFFVLAGCGKKTTKLELPEGISLVDQTLSADKLKLNAEIELLITVPEGKELDKLMVNEEDKTTDVVDDKFKVVVTKNLKLSVTFKDKVKTMSLTLPNGVSLVNKELNADKLPLNLEIELLITAPLGKSLDKLLIRGEDKTTNVVDNKFKVVVTNDLSISVTFKDPVIYTISLDLDGGTGVEEVKVEEGKTPEIPVPLKDGFVFDKWVLSDDTDYVLGPVTSDLSLKAVYVKTYEITLVEGVTVLEDVDLNNVKSGTKITFVLDVPEGHVVYLLMINGDDFDSYVVDNKLEWTVTENVIVSIFETLELMTVTLDLDGGVYEGVELVHQVKKGFRFSIPSNESPTKGGHTFKEWQHNGVTYNFTEGVNENITLKAVYEEKFMFIVSGTESLAGNVVIHGEVLSGTVKKGDRVYIRGEGMELDIYNIYIDAVEVNEVSKGDKASFIVRDQIVEENIHDNDLMYFMGEFSEVQTFEARVKLFTTAEGGLLSPLELNAAFDIYVWKQDLKANVIAITDLEGKPVEKALPGEEYIMKIKITADHHIIYQSQSLAFRIGGKSFMTGIVLGF